MKPTLEDILLGQARIRRPGTTECLQWNPRTSEIEDRHTGYSLALAQLLANYESTNWEFYVPPPPAPQNCPVCGGSALVGHAERGFWVTCSDYVDCGLEGPLAEAKKAAIEAWNRLSYKD